MIREDAQDRTTVNGGIFAGGDPFEIAVNWLETAWKSEPNDANAIALSTVGADGLPNARIMLLKEIEPNGFVFYTNRESAKGDELSQNPKAAFVLHWKSLRRQIRARGAIELVDDAQSEAYFSTRPPQSRAGAVASQQSRPLDRRETLLEATDAALAEHKDAPPRPDYWGGYRILPTEIEFWANGEYRLHDRFRWTREASDSEDWSITRLYP